jgi:hypothetical protein
MIAHLAPRRVAVVSDFGGQRQSYPIDVDSILAVDLWTGSPDQVALQLRLTGGRQVVAGTYADEAEAGCDCGRLRLLAGLPVWPGEECTAAVPSERGGRRWLESVAGWIGAGLASITCTSR